jgi:hypothetical protein
MMARKDDGTVDARRLVFPLGLVLTVAASLIASAVGYGKLQATVQAEGERITKLERQLEKIDRIDKAITRIETLLEERTVRK